MTRSRPPKELPDPRGPELERWLREQRPEAELVMRLAWRGVSPHCRGDRAWSLRIDDLLKIAAPSEKELARLLAEAGKAEEFLRKDA